MKQVQGILHSQRYDTVLPYSYILEDTIKKALRRDSVFQQRAQGGLTAPGRNAPSQTGCPFVCGTVLDTHCSS